MQDERAPGERPVDDTQRMPGETQRMPESAADAPAPWAQAPARREEPPPAAPGDTPTVSFGGEAGVPSPYGPPPAAPPAYPPPAYPPTPVYSPPPAPPLTPPYSPPAGVWADGGRGRACRGVWWLWGRAGSAPGE